MPRPVVPVFGTFDALFAGAGPTRRGRAMISGVFSAIISVSGRALDALARIGFRFLSAGATGQAQHRCR